MAPGIDSLVSSDEDGGDSRNTAIIGGVWESDGSLAMGFFEIADTAVERWKAGRRNDLIVIPIIYNLGVVVMATGLKRTCTCRCIHCDHGQHCYGSISCYSMHGRWSGSVPAEQFDGTSGCGTAILVLIWAFFAAFFGFLVYTYPHVSAETVRNAGDPLTNGFFLADASVVALGLVSMAIAVLVMGKGLGRVVGLTVFLALLVTELVFIFRFHQLYLRS
jgi:hypothetical protein